MEARAALHGSVISKSMVAVLTAVLAAFLLGGFGGYAVKSLSLPPAAAQHHVLAGQTAASDFGSAWNFSTQRSGTQTIEGPAPVVELPTTASFREPSTGRGGPQS